MKITVDTNILVRLLTEDDEDQAARARRTLSDANRLVLPLPMLCELVWVLSRSYRLASAEIADAVRSLATSERVTADRAAVEAGLALMAAGGDFADGVIAHLGNGAGGEVFMSFDQRAVERLQALGVNARVPA